MRGMDLAPHKYLIYPNAEHTYQHNLSLTYLVYPQHTEIYPSHISHFTTLAMTFPRGPEVIYSQG